MEDKVLSIIKEKQERGLEICLDLGCRDGKKNPDSIGIDLVEFDGVDLVGDAFEILQLFPKESVDKIYASHFIEHIDDISRILSIFEKCLKAEGEICLIAPHFSNPYFYSDPTHKNFFGLYTFCYYIKSNIFSRKVPLYKNQFSLELITVNLIFKSPKPFYIRYVIKKFLGFIFNLNSFFRELHEEWFCYLLPCYEIEYIIKKHEK